jgi:hypothetical protein
MKPGGPVNNPIPTRFLAPRLSKNSSSERKTKKEMRKEQRGNYGEGVFNVEDNTVEIREEKAIVRLRRQEDHMGRGKMSRNLKEKIWKVGSLKDRRALEYKEERPQRRAKAGRLERRAKT